MKLSVVCMTQGKPPAEPFLKHFGDVADRLGAEFIIGVNAPDVPAYLRETQRDVVHVPESVSLLEEVLDILFAQASGDYVLRMDDDERISQSMLDWLVTEAYSRQDSWFFSRYHFWPDGEHVIVMHPYFPDFQVRLTTRAKSSRPAVIHAASPWPSWRASGYIEHHHFLAKTREERRILTAHYATLMHGVLCPPDSVTYIFPDDTPSDKVVLAPITPENVAKLQRTADTIPFWREHGMEVPPDLDRSLKAWAAERG